MVHAYPCNLFWVAGLYVPVGLTTYILVHRDRPGALPEWYAASERGLREKVLFCLWALATIVLWPFVLSAWLNARFGPGVREKLISMARGARATGRRLCVGSGGGGREPAGGRRHAVDLERWAEVPLDEERATGSRAPMALGIFINPFEDRGRARSRTSRPDSSESRSPKDCRGRGPAATPEQPPIVWYNNLPSPAEMQGATAQASSGGNGIDNGDGSSSSAEPASLPRVADEVVDGDRAGKDKFLQLQQLQTI